MAHANARLTPAGRLTLVGRIAAQPRRPIAHTAHEMGVSRTTAYRWWGRYQQLGQAGLVDRPSIPLRSPRRTAARLEERILRLRRRERLGPARIAARLGLPASTVHRVLVRHRMNRLGWLDRPTGRPIRRYEHDQPGDLVHLDVKKLGRIPAGGGHRAHGRATGTVNRRADRSSGGYDDLHAAVDDHSRLAYVELLGDERAQSCARFWRRAHHWFALHGITVSRVLTDNGVGYRSRLFGTALASTGVRHYKVESADSGGSLAVLEIEIPARTLVKPHNHSREDEFSLVLAGTVGFRIGDRVQLAHPGAALVKPRGTPHAMWNSYHTPARC
jgi:quercetin dioxygenase-like cupin family protein